MSAYKRDEKVHDEWECRIIQSSQGKNRFYRVFIGTVLWRDNILRKACVVFIQYGNSKEWRQACSRKEIAFDEPAHILVEDYESINNAITELVSNYPDKGDN